MPNRIDAAEYAMEATSPNGVIDRVVAHPKCAHLRSLDHSVLGLGEFS